MFAAAFGFRRNHASTTTLRFALWRITKQLNQVVAAAVPSLGGEVISCWERGARENGAPTGFPPEPGMISSASGSTFLKYFSDPPCEMHRQPSIQKGEGGASVTLAPFSARCSGVEYFDSLEKVGWFGNLYVSQMAAPIWRNTFLEGTKDRNQSRSPSAHI